jgi:AraC-like DNA-binding protein
VPHRSRTSAQRIERSKLPASLFTTAELSSDRRFQAWRESIGVIFDVRTLSEPAADFDARIESYLLEDVMLARCSAGAQKFDRNAIRIARDSIDHYMIQIFLQGHVEMKHGRDSFRMEAGGVIAFDFTDVLDSFNSDFDLLSFVIPRRRLAPLLKQPDSLQGARIDPDTGSGLLLANYGRTLYAAAPTLTPAEGSIAARTLIDLAALAFNGADFGTGDLPELAQQAELMRVQGYIKDRLSIPGLGPDAVADGIGMSRARLYRLFAPIGGVAEYIREQRLRRCLADLLSAQHAHRQIADIAYGWGFGDPVSFAKTFKLRFGKTPSDAREAGRSGAIPDPRIGDRLYEQWIAGLA